MYSKRATELKQEKLELISSVFFLQQGHLDSIHFHYGESGCGVSELGGVEHLLFFFFFLRHVCSCKLWGVGECTAIYDYVGMRRVRRVGL